MQAFLAKVYAVVDKVETYASTITTAGAIAFTAVDPTKLPPKYAAIVIGVSNVTRVVDKFLPTLKSKTGKVEAEITQIETYIAHEAALLPHQIKSITGDTSKAAPVATQGNPSTSSPSAVEPSGSQAPVPTA